MGGERKWERETKKERERVVKGGRERETKREIEKYVCEDFVLMIEVIKY